MCEWHGEVSRNFGEKEGQFRAQNCRKRPRLRRKNTFFEKSCQKTWSNVTYLLLLYRRKTIKEFFNIMKTNELIKRLSQAGCWIIRPGARHDIWYSPITGKQAPVPRHGAKEIPKGTLRRIEKELLGF